jgi:hypothetical protein
VSFHDTTGSITSSPENSLQAGRIQQAINADRFFRLQIGYVRQQERELRSSTPDACPAVRAG